MVEQDEASKYLENKILYLKPVPRKSDMVGDPSHIRYFKMENASDKYTLKMDNLTNRVINPFKDDEELKFFSEQMGADLNPYKKNNEFWKNYYITITKTPELMRIGKRFDLSNVEDALAYRVLLTWKKEIIDGWENRMNYSTIRYAFVAEDYEEVKAQTEMDETFRIGEVYGELKGNNNKMKDFINIYYQTKHKAVNVPEDSDTKFLVAELSKIAKQDKEGFLNLYEDKNYSTKVFIAKCMKKGLINREGVGTYTISGLGTEYTYDELINQIKDWEETGTEPIYAKLVANLKSK